jgi:hypothetical protein
MKRKTNRKNLDSTKKAFAELIETFESSTPDIQRKIIWLISALIKNLTDSHLKNFWISCLEIIKSIAPELDTFNDLEEVEKLREDFTEFFESVEKHQSETVSALEEISKPEVAE